MSINVYDPETLTLIIPNLAIKCDRSDGLFSYFITQNELKSNKFRINQRDNATKICDNY